MTYLILGAIGAGVLGLLGFFFRKKNPNVTPYIDPKDADKMKKDIDKKADSEKESVIDSVKKKMDKFREKFK